MKKGLLFVFCLLLLQVSKAQDTETDNHVVKITIPEVAILDIESVLTKNIELSFTKPTEAGLGVVGSTNSSLWLNYSSIKSTGNPTRAVSVKLSEVVSGATIKLLAGAAAGSGSGTLGSPSGELSLTASEQNLISDIGSCYTGNGANNGHQLTYKLEVGDYANLESITDKAITVTYTISN